MYQNCTILVRSRIATCDEQFWYIPDDQVFLFSIEQAYPVPNAIAMPQPKKSISEGLKATGPDNTGNLYIINDNAISYPSFSIGSFIGEQMLFFMDCE